MYSKLMHDLEDIGNGAGSEVSDWEYKDSDGNVSKITLDIDYTYSPDTKVERCKTCGLKVINDEPKFPTCEEVFVNEVMGS